MRTRRSFKLASNCLVFKRQKPYQAWFVYIRQTNAWQLYKLSANALRARGKITNLGTLAVVPYDARLTRIAIRECPNNIQVCIRMLVNESNA